MTKIHNNRLPKDTEAHFTDLKDLRAAYGFKPVTNRTSDNQKLEQQKERFLGKCKICGNPMSFIPGTNIITCKNNDCKGVTVKLKDGTEKSIPVNRLLDQKGSEIGNTLFA